MQQKVLVVLTNEEMVFCTKIIVECPLEMDYVILEVDLLVFELLGFDIILSMDWLFKHFASIGCRQRTMTTQVLRMKDRVFWSSKLQSMPGMITSVQIKKELVSRFKAYLVHLVHKEKEPKEEVRCILVVRVFPEVWGELPKLPPPRKVTFFIEFELGTVPVHKAPYRMTSIKLKELKSCDTPKSRLGLDGV